jgi:hypothetical protein
LRLSGNALGADAAVLIGSRVLKEPLSPLRALDLTENAFGGRAVALLCQGLRAHPSPWRLRELRTDGDLALRWRELGLEEWDQGETLAEDGEWRAEDLAARASVTESGRRDGDGVGVGPSGNGRTLERLRVRAAFAHQAKRAAKPFVVPPLPSTPSVLQAGDLQAGEAFQGKSVEQASSQPTEGTIGALIPHPVYLSARNFIFFIVDAILFA